MVLTHYILKALSASTLYPKEYQLGIEWVVTDIFAWLDLTIVIAGGFFLLYESAHGVWFGGDRGLTPF